MRGALVTAGVRPGSQVSRCESHPAAAFFSSSAMLRICLVMLNSNFECLVTPITRQNVPTVVEPCAGHVPRRRGPVDNALLDCRLDARGVSLGCPVLCYLVLCWVVASPLSDLERYSRALNHFLELTFCSCGPIGRLLSVHGMRLRDVRRAPCAACDDDLPDALAPHAVRR
jgi:hypothetical protein